jgi:hypothetical protein
MARSKNNYCNKEELNALVTEWIHSTNSGNGDWLEKWKTAAETKAKGKQYKLDDINKFFDYRKKLYEGPRNAMDPLREKRLWDIIQTIVKNRIRTFNFKSEEDREDAEQDAFIAVFKYLNRFDTNRGSSVFSYVTELITNGILLNIKDDKDSEWCRISLDNVLTERMCKHYYGDDLESTEE